MTIQAKIRGKGSLGGAILMDSCNGNPVNPTPAAGAHRASILSARNLLPLLLILVVLIGLVPGAGSV